MDHNFWDVFFLLLIFIPLLLIWAFSIFDIFRRDDLGGLAKGIWLVVVILIPLFGTFVYLIFRRPGATGEERQAIDDAPSSADQLRTLSELHDAGKLTDDEFTKEKARVIQGSPA